MKLKPILVSFLILAVFSVTAQEEKKENPFTFKWDNGFKMESADKQFKFKFGGRVMIDHAIFTQNSDLDATFGELETKNGTEFRRARVFVSGDIYNNVEFKLQAEFSGGEVKIKDAYIGITGIPAIGTFRVGHVKEPLRLDVLTSSKYITFMERSFPTDFAQERNNGFLVFNDFLDKKLSLQAGYFRNSDDTANAIAANDGYSLTGRATSLVLNNKEEKQLLHLGVGASLRKTDSREYRLRSRPEAHLSGIRYVDTGTITDVESITLVNFETAFVSGPLAIQGEYLMANVKTGNVTVIDSYNFGSYYAQVSYFLTGESKIFKGSYEGFDRVKPTDNFGGDNKGLGAWEVALRYSNSDLNSKDVFGGEQSDITLGLNWYLNPVTRIMLNHVWADVKDAGNANIFQVRFQLDF